MSVRRSLLILALLMIALPPGVLWVNANRNAADDISTRNLQVHTVGSGSVEVLVSAIGSVEAAQVVNLNFPTAGRVAEIFVEAGDQVSAGDPLIRLANDGQRIAYEQALLELESAEIELERLRGPVSESDLRIAQANLDSAWGQYLSAQNAISDQDIRAAELAYQQARENYDTLRTERDRAVGGFGSPTYQTLDALTGAASFNTEIARLRLENLRSGTRPQLNAAYARVLQAQRELERVEAGPNGVQIEQAEIRVRQAQAGVTRAEREYYRTLLTAPFDGIVSALMTEIGGLTGPGVTVIELTDVSQLQLTVQVDEIDISLIEAGQPARIQIDALPGIELNAALDRIAPSGTPDNGIVSYAVDVAFLESAVDVRVGMTAEASVVVEEVHDVLVVPNLYIRRDRSNRAFVDVLRDGRLVSDVEITLGLIGQDNSEVVAGLQLGDVVAIDPASDRFFGG